MSENTHFLSIIICAYNERRTIREAIQQACDVNLGPGWNKEVIVVDNFSTDGTRDLLKSLDLPDVKVVFHARNRGKSASILTGIGEAQGDYFAVFDADLEYDADDLIHMTAAVRPGETVAVFGSRTLGGRRIYEYAENYWGVKVLTWLANRVFGGHLTDIAVGLKLAHVDTVRSLDLSQRDFDFDFELPCRLLRNGHDIVEVPVAYHPRTAEQGKGLVGLHAYETGLRWLWILATVAIGW